MIIFDIGANIGKWTVSNINCIDQIIAVEPSPSAFCKLQDNIERLPRSLSNNVRLLNYAVHNDDLVEFYECKKHRYSTTNKDWVTHKKSRYYGKEYQIIKCKTISLDKMISLYGIPDLIKIDVEGGEYNCLKTLTKKTPCICFEWAKEFVELANNCLEYLYHLGFRYVYVQYEDIYQFRPCDNRYKPIQHLQDLLQIFPSIDKRDDWGMVWCK